MKQPKTILITGAAGNLGRKLRHHLDGRCELRLLDRDARGDASIATADMAQWDDSWVRLFRGADVVFHFAADPEAHHGWTELTAPNVDAVINAYQAAVLAKAPRFVFASSNHVMGGYQDAPGGRITTDLPPRPGSHYISAGESRNSLAYAAAKLFGERLGKCCAAAHGMEVIAVRIGWNIRSGPNDAASLPRDRGEWFRLMWLSDRDFCHLMDRCLLAELPEKFVVLNGMSANTGMAWDLSDTCRIMGYRPLDDVSLPTPKETESNTR